MNNYNYSDNDGFSLSEQDAEELATRLQVGKSIITFNATKLRGNCSTLLTFHESFRRNILLINDFALSKPTLNSKQMAMALEFYLQIDGKSSLCINSLMHTYIFLYLSVDMFYMKTCSFRGAEPLLSNNIEQGLFCGKDEPQERYLMHPCSNLFCPCCNPRNNSKKSQSWPVVDFISSSKHQFVNGYITYLNCSAVCFPFQIYH
jgi:hypothetical protein